MTERWPAWARPQLLAAIECASSASGHRPLAAQLYERWYAVTAPVGAGTPARPLVGEYRRAHAGTATWVRDGVTVLERYDRIGPDGWWRTWNTTWRPPAGSARVLLSPRPDAVAGLVAELTGGLRDVPYLLAAPAEPRRLAASGAVVLHVPRVRLLSDALLAAVAPLLRPDSPPLCLPLAPGIAAAEYPANGMTFGEHRCHLVALARPGAGAGTGIGLDAIAEVFAAHGVDPAAPHRAARRS